MEVDQCWSEAGVGSLALKLISSRDGWRCRDAAYQAATSHSTCLPRTDRATRWKSAGSPLRMAVERQLHGLNSVPPLIGGVLRGRAFRPSAIFASESTTPQYHLKEARCNYHLYDKKDDGKIGMMILKVVNNIKDDEVVIKMHAHGKRLNPPR